jgi:hypothetical protein
MPSLQERKEPLGCLSGSIGHEEDEATRPFAYLGSTISNGACGDDVAGGRIEQYHVGIVEVVKKHIYEKLTP